MYLGATNRANGFPLRCVQEITDGSEAPSRLRGIGLIRRERCRISVPREIFGLPLFWVRSVIGRYFTVWALVLLRQVVRIAFRCVVSKKLRIVPKTSRLRGTGISRRER